MQAVISAGECIASHLLYSSPGTLAWQFDVKRFDKEKCHTTDFSTCPNTGIMSLVGACKSGFRLPSHFLSSNRRLNRGIVGPAKFSPTVLKF